MELRQYQREAVDAVWSSLKSGVPAPLVVLPTGAGKSPVVATLCAEAVVRWRARVLVLVHVRELVEQLEATMRRMWPEEHPPIGVMCAGLRRKETPAVTIASIQTAVKNVTEIASRNLVIIDESHMVPPEGEGMYRSVISDLKLFNPSLRVIGLTATPYRTGYGVIYGEGNIFSDIVYDAPVGQLIDDGYLSRIFGKNGGSPDLQGVHRRLGEFVEADLEEVMVDHVKVERAVDEIARYMLGKQGVLIFCCSIKHCEMVTNELEKRGEQPKMLTSKTPSSERDKMVADFKDRSLRILVNMNIASVGFDAPHVDLVVMLRPTLSPGLYYQQMGRGFRICPDKTACVILDLAGNIERHGPITTLNERMEDSGVSVRVPKMVTCSKCNEIYEDNHQHKCPACGYTEEPEEVKEDLEIKPKTHARHGVEASDADPLYAKPPEWEAIDDCVYSVHVKKSDPNAPPSIRVDYYLGLMHKVCSEWVCVEHKGYAKQRAIKFLSNRIPANWTMDPQGVINHKGDLIKFSSEAMADIDFYKWLRMPKALLIDRSGKWPNIQNYEFDEERLNATTENDYLPF